MSWPNEPRRHGLARRGIKTNIDDKTRFDVSKFIARGTEYPILVTDDQTDDFRDAWDGIVMAYGDENKFFDYSSRNLNFRSDFALTPELAKQIMEDALSKYGMYNEFTPGKIDNLEQLFDKPIVTLAREGSVAIYVHGTPTESLSTIKKLMDADDVRTMQPNITKIWWD